MDSQISHKCVHKKEFFISLSRYGTMIGQLSRPKFVWIEIFFPLFEPTDKIFTLLTVFFSVHTVSYRTLFSQLGFMACRLRTWAITPSGKNLVPLLQYGLRKQDYLVRSIMAVMIWKYVLETWVTLVSLKILLGNNKPVWITHLYRAWRLAHVVERRTAARELEVSIPRPNKHSGF